MPLFYPILIKHDFYVFHVLELFCACSLDNDFPSSFWCINNSVQNSKHGTTQHHFKMLGKVMPGMATYILMPWMHTKEKTSRGNLPSASHTQVTHVPATRGHSIAPTRKGNGHSIAEICCANSSATLKWPPVMLWKCTDNTFHQHGIYVLPRNCDIS